MKTRVVIDDALIAEVMRLTGIGSEREVVDTALRLLLRVTLQRRMREARGCLRWEGNLGELRQGRSPGNDHGRR